MNVLHLYITIIIYESSPFIRTYNHLHTFPNNLLHIFTPAYLYSYVPISPNPHFIHHHSQSCLPCSTMEKCNFTSLRESLWPKPLPEELQFVVITVSQTRMVT